MVSAERLYAQNQGGSTTWPGIRTEVLVLTILLKIIDKINVTL